MNDDKVREFESLFGEFAVSYLGSSEGATHLANYTRLRAEAAEGLRAVDEAESRSAPTTDIVLLKLLPWTDSTANRERGAWIHVAPAITGDLKGWFEGAGWTRRDDWPDVAKAILAFVRRCIESPEELAPAVAEFTELSYLKGFQAGVLSPALNALRPEWYAILNSKSRVALNYFAEANYGTRLQEYPEANERLRDVVRELAPIIQRVSQSSAEPLDLFDSFTHWLKAIKQFDFGVTAYWKIAPGEGARFWNDWRDNNFASIGWSELGDISALSYSQFAERRAELQPLHTDWTKEALEQVWTFAHMQEGDRVVANRGTTEVLGIGTVSGPYYYAPDNEYPHRVPVLWDDVQPRRVDRGGWRRTLLKLSRQDFEDIAAASPLKHEAHGHIFIDTTFELLDGLRADPTASYYEANKEAFKRYVEDPFRHLMIEIGRRLPSAMRERLETERNIVSRIRKNDWGRGGAWDFYWGAFYPKGGSRVGGTQLFAVISPDGLQYGFSIEAAARAEQERFRGRVRDHRQSIMNLFAEGLRDLGLAPEDGHGDFGAWLDEPASDERRLRASISRAAVVQATEDDLIALISTGFQALYPLFRIAVEDAPVLDELETLQEGDDVQPPYSLEELAEDTSLDRDLLQSWLVAIDHKGQAIIYGPPGTGKTYIAERLAQRIVEGGRGFTQLVQFHPSYAYEDFIEGIRPKTNNGQLTYEPSSGRFLEFCIQAEARRDPSVMIIDEINRANLSKVFGELMYLLEYRKKTIPLAGGRQFRIPENVRIIGTMNTADRSIALVDHALRRRFAFLELRPQYDVLRRYHGSTGFPVEELISTLRRVNEEIGDPNYELGISYFLDDHLELTIEGIWRTEIEPYLAEHFFGSAHKLDPFRWDKLRAQLRLPQAVP